MVGGWLWQECACWQAGRWLCFSPALLHAAEVTNKLSCQIFMALSIAFCHHVPLPFPSCVYVKCCPIPSSNTDVPCQLLAPRCSPLPCCVCAASFPLQAQICSFRRPLPPPCAPQIRQKNLFSVSGINICWHPQGHYLAVKVLDSFGGCSLSLSLDCCSLSLWQ